MGRRLRGLAIVSGLLLVAAAVFLVPTLWLRPWSIDHFFLRVLARYALESPMLLSELRILEPWGIRFHDDDLDDFSVEFARKRVRWARSELATLRSYDRRSLDPEQRRSRDVMEWYLQTLVDGEPFLLHDYPINQLDGVQNTLPEFMLRTHALTDDRDARDYVERLSKFGLALDQAIDGMRRRARIGVVPPRFVIQRVREQVKGFVAPAPADNPLQRRLAEALPGLEMSDARRAALEAASRAMIENVVYPAYGRVLDLLDELEPKATDEAGAWKLPDGAAYYAWTLRWHTTTDLDADSIHALGLAETARIQAEIHAILANQGIDASDLPAALAALHADPRFLYPDGDAGRAMILRDYRAIIADAQQRLPALFGRLPAAPVVVARVPPFKEDGAPAAYYRPPAFDGSRPGTFYVNLRNVEETPRFAMRTLAYHEAIPGHHLQIALAFENRSLPLFRRLIPFDAFIEGWALYAERLAAEEGFDPTPWDRLGQLVAELFRAVRLVVDTGIHARRWTREQAIAYMHENTGMPMGDVVSEVERYVVDPGQACAYKVGQLRILALRDHAREVLGPRFDLREFHDVVLGNGSLPLVQLDDVVEEWLAGKAR